MLTVSPAIASASASQWLRPAGQAAPLQSAGSAPASLAAPGQPERLITFVEPAESFLSLSIRNFGMTLATLGFYSFWARADARKQLHHALRIKGQPLDYTGTGREACIAFLMGIATMAAVVSLSLWFLFKSGVNAGQISRGVGEFRLQRLLVTLPLLFLLGSVAYRKRKEILRRTWWRGEHFDLNGQPWAYAFHHFWTAFLVPLTLGWAGPWRASWLERRKINEMCLGDHRFQAVGGVTNLYRAFAALWFGGGTIYVATMVLIGVTIGDEVLGAVARQTLAPLMNAKTLTTGAWVLSIGLTPVIGFILFYRAAWIEHQISSLVFDDQQLELTLPKWRFAGLMLWNSFIKLVSFGAFAPVADAALVRFIVARITTRPWAAAPAGSA